MGDSVFELGLDFFEYFFQIPANRIGSSEIGGPLSLVKPKIIQEVIRLIIFMPFSVLVVKNVQFTRNHIIGF